VTFETVEKMMQYSRKPTSAMPNAGHPSLVDGRKLYLCSPEYMAQYARRMLWAGVKIVGGLLRHHPEHIKMVRAEARSLQPGRRDHNIAVESRRRLCLPWNLFRPQRNQGSGRTSPRDDSSRSSKSCRRAGHVFGRDRGFPEPVPRRASIASTCRTGRGQAHA